MALNGDLHASTASPPESNNTWYKRIPGSVDLRLGLGAVEKKTVSLPRNNPLFLSLEARTLIPVLFGKHWNEENTCPSEE